MVNLHIYKTGNKYWYTSLQEGFAYNNILIYDNSNLYCYQNNDQSNEVVQYFYCDDGKETVHCNSKAEYLKLIKLKILW